MPSRSLQLWNHEAAKALDEIEAAHLAVGGKAPGRRYATHQINQAYAVLLSSQFQRFCRNLHSEAVDHLTSTIKDVRLLDIVRRELLRDRKLDSRNPTPGHIGSDFGRLRLSIWTAVYKRDRRNEDRNRRLEELNNWRNAIAHQDFDPKKLGGQMAVGLQQVRRWRRTCEALARAFDLATEAHLVTITRVAPW